MAEDAEMIQVSVWDSCAYPAPPVRYNISVPFKSTIKDLRAKIASHLSIKPESFEIKDFAGKEKYVEEYTIIAGEGKPFRCNITSTPAFREEFQTKRANANSPFKTPTPSNSFSINHATPSSHRSSSPPSHSSSIDHHYSSRERYGMRSSDDAGLLAYGPARPSGNFSSYSSIDYSKKSATGYVGLNNQGATCYMNSLIQNLFMTPEFRKAVYSWSAEDAFEKTLRENPQQDGNTDHEKVMIELAKKSIPFQLQKLFARLQFSEKRSVDTEDLTTSFGWVGEDAFTQHDVQELCRVLFDALEAKMKGTDQANLINDLYQGQMKDYVKCKECGHESSRTDPFLDISLVIRPFGETHAIGSIEEALSKFVQPETLDGDNQYFCERCNKKVDAQKGLKFTKFPYLMTFQLKRFDFDYEQMRRVKLNDRVSFPRKIDMSKWLGDPETSEKESNGETKDSMDVDDKEQKPNGKRGPESTDSEGSLSTLESDNMYELFSVLIHRGSSMMGHYYAYIKSFIDDKWYEFDDSTVSEMDENKLKDAYGEEKKSGGYWSRGNAYMLMYRKIDAQRNVPGIKKEDVPASVKAYIDKDQKDVSQKDKESKLLHLRVHHGDQMKTLDIDKSLKIKDFLTKIKEEFLLPQPVENIRARVFDVPTRIPGKETFSYDEDRTLNSSYYIDNDKQYTVEVKNEGEEFPDQYARIVLWDSDAGAWKPHFVLPVWKEQSVEAVKNAIEKQTGLPKSRQHLTAEKKEQYATSSQIIELNENHQPIGGLPPGTKIFVEDTEAGAPTRATGEIERTKEYITLYFNVPPSQEPTHYVEIDKNKTLFDLKELISPVLGLTLDEFRVLRSFGPQSELKQEKDQLGQAYLYHGSKICIEKGKPLRNGEIKLKFALLELNPQTDEHTAEELFELSIPEAIEISKLKEILAKNMLEQKKIEVPGGPSHLRVREIASQAASPAKILPHTSNLKKAAGWLSVGKTFIVQKLPYEEPVQTEKEAAIYVQQFFPDKYGFGPKEEIVVKEDCENFEDEVRAFILKNHPNIAAENLSIAKADFFPHPLEIDELRWDPGANSSSTISVRSLTPWAHSIVLFKDKTVPLKELSQKEMQQLKRQRAAQQHRGTSREEKALKIRTT